MLSNFPFFNSGRKSFPWTLFVIWWIIYHGATGERSNPIKSKYDKVMQTNPLEWVIIVTLVLNKVHYHIQCPTGTQTRHFFRYLTFFQIPDQTRFSFESCHVDSPSKTASVHWAISSQHQQQSQQQNSSRALSESWHSIKNIELEPGSDFWQLCAT